MSNTSKYVAKSFIWGTISKFSDAGIKFISVPLLLNYFGKSDFGLISLAISVNAYLQLLNMGVNTGAIKFFSEWIGQNNIERVNKVAKTTLSFYSIIGIINAIILLIVATWGLHLFNLKYSEELLLQKFLYVLAIFAIVNWFTAVFNQLITANENIYFVQQINLLKSALNLGFIYITLSFHFTLVQYFWGYTAINSLQIVPFIWKVKRDRLIKNIIPGIYWQDFKPVLKYSIAILMIGIFSMTATQMRPIILGLFSDNTTNVIADFRIMETITMFVISIGGMFTSIFLPKTSKLLQQNDHSKVENFAYTGTLYTSIICTALCFPIIINSKELLSLYVGDEFVHLSGWLILWLYTILAYLHNSPVASLVLSTGKTRVLILSSAVSCIVSLVINAALCKQLDAGSAVLGYSVYIVVQMSVYYFYFNKKILKLNSLSVFRSFIYPVIAGIAAAAIVKVLPLSIPNTFVQVSLNSAIWILLYFTLLLSFRIVKTDLVKSILIRKNV